MNEVANVNKCSWQVCLAYIKPVTSTNATFCQSYL